MTQLAFFIEQASTGLILLCAIPLLFNLRSLMMARRELYRAEFELEREFAHRRQAGAITWVLLSIELALGIYAVAHVVAPTMRSDLTLQGAQGPAEAVAFLTPVPGATVVNAQGTPLLNRPPDDPLRAQPDDPNNVIQATPTISPTPPGTLIPNPPPAIGCTSPEAMLQVPANGQVLFESVTVLGTAQTGNFANYRFELSGPSTGNAFAPYGGDKTSPVTSVGALGQLSLIPFQPGTYQFRLAVFNSKSELKASCTVTVYLRLRPTATATPTALGGASK